MGGSCTSSQKSPSSGTQGSSCLSHQKWSPRQQAPTADLAAEFHCGAELSGRAHPSLGLSRTAALRRGVGSVGGNGEKKKPQGLHHLIRIMFLGKGVDRIDSSAFTEGESVKAVWRSQGGLLEVGIKDMSREKGLSCRGHRGTAKDKRQDSGSLLSVCACGRSCLGEGWGGGGKLFSLARQPEGNPPPCRAQNSPKGELKGKGGSWHEAGHRPLTTSPGPRRGKGDPLGWGGEGRQNVTGDLKTM